jgi:hypothetical protein
MMLILLGGLACGQHSTDLVSHLDKPGEPLLEGIPKADPTKYHAIRDALDWNNPFLTVYATEVEISSPRLPGGKIMVPLDKTVSALEDLPAALGLMGGWWRWQSLP